MKTDWIFPFLIAWFVYRCVCRTNNDDEAGIVAIFCATQKYQSKINKDDLSLRDCLPAHARRKHSNVLSTTHITVMTFKYHSVNTWTATIDCLPAGLLSLSIENRFSTRQHTFRWPKENHFTSISGRIFETLRSSTYTVGYHFLHCLRHDHRGMTTFWVNDISTHSLAAFPLLPIKHSNGHESYAVHDIIVIGRIDHSDLCRTMWPSNPACDAWMCWHLEWSERWLLEGSLLDSGDAQITERDFI